jgi:small-conductance mechanosensitive channel
MVRAAARPVGAFAPAGVRRAKFQGLRFVALAWSLLIASGLALLAFPPYAMAANPPPGMTTEQFDSLVAAVAETLSKGLAQPAPARSGAGPDEEYSIDIAAQRVNELVRRTPNVLAAVPELPAQTARVLGRFDRTAAGGTSAGLFLLLLLMSCAASVGVGWACLALLVPLRRGLAGDATAPLPISNVFRLAILDAAAFGAVWILTRIALGSLFAGQHSQGAFARSVLDMVVIGAAAAATFEIWLRPSLPVARLALVDDEGARRLNRLLVTSVVIVAASRTWLGLIATPFLVSAALLVNAFVVTGTYAWVVRRGRNDLGSWFAGLRTPSPGTDLIAQSTRLVQRVALPFIGLIFLLRLYSALSGRPSVPLGTIATVSIVILLLLSETLIRWLLRHPSLQHAEKGLGVRLARSAVRFARIVALLLAGLALVRVWMVDALGIVAEPDWLGWSWPLWQAALYGLGGALMWEAVRVATDPYVGQRPAGVPVDAEEATQDTVSRAKTLAPLLRVAALILVVAITVLAMLSALGVNITPLIAGASILGLAISFGSQTLVRDIVSGVFYLAEDAFRVGEYIDCGNAQGTVEGFALRSLKLRHQNGQVHTIPFGQLGQVTNFSRDWSTVKFNLKFTRDTDVEKLRKAVKKIGQEMLEDPELKAEIIEPLKMQGVTDILENAIVARFKFTVRPGKPSFIQRDAVKRMVQALPGLGIEFASATFAVQGLGNDAAVAGAAAAQMQARAQAETSASAT